MQKRKKNSPDYRVAVRRFSALTALALLCTGCHYESNKEINEFRECNLQADLDVIYTGVPELSSALTLEEIYDIAGQRNLNILVKGLEYDIQKELVTRERFGMLPDIRTHFERLIRNRNTASSSQSLVPGVPPAPLSISSQKHQRRWDYAVVWNYVDFGLAFLRSRQEFNRALKLQFEYQRIQQNLFVDVTRQYWKAQTAKLARRKSKLILEKAKAQQLAVQKQLEAKIISEIQGLRNEGQLITFQAQFQFYDKEYHTAISELGLLMGLPPCVVFELADVVTFGVDVCLPDICELETLALYNRPELYSDDAEELIQRDEARAAVLQMYPGVDLFAGHNHDSNKFLLFNHWIQAGTRIAYNLLDWPRHLQESRAADGRVLLAKNNRVLMSISVMTQVHLAHAIYLDNLETYQLSRSLEDINTRLLKAAQSEQREGKLHEADVLKYEIEVLETQIDSLKQYGEVNNALEQLNNALGLPLYYTNERQYGVTEDVTLVKKEAPREEAQQNEAEELREIYLDYIIKNIEKEEEQKLHKKSEAHEEEIQRRVRAEENRLRERAGSASPQSANEQEDDGDEQDQATASIDDILKKYHTDEDSDADKGSVDELIHKYVSDDPINPSGEEDENIQSSIQQKNPLRAHDGRFMDAMALLFTRIKSLL